MSNGFAVAANGSSIQTATGPNKLLSMSNPFTKLDTTNQVSFQTIQVLLNHEPPQAPNTSPFYTNTLIYQFKHGYNYVPATWMSFQNPSPAYPASPSSGNSATTFFPNGDDTSGLDAFNETGGHNNSNPNSLLAQTLYNNGGGAFIATNAILFISVDSIYVNLYIQKQAIALVGGAIIPMFLIGVVLNVRIYVFTEPATTSTY